MERKKKKMPICGEDSILDYELSEMLENPDTYSEEQIRTIIDRSEDSRETYETMVEVRQSYRFRHAADREIDVDRAWECFEKKHLQSATPVMKLRKVAAVIVTILAVSGVAIAAIYTIGRHSENSIGRTRKTATALSNDVLMAQDSIVVKPITYSEPKTFDNVRLDEMLGEIARHYGCTLNFRNDEIRSLRLYFQWNPEEPIEKVIEKLNLFEHINVVCEEQCLTVE